MIQFIDEGVDTFQEQPYFNSQQDYGFFETLGRSLVRGSLSVAKGLVGTAEEAFELLPGIEEENYLTTVRENIAKEEEAWGVTPDNAWEWGASIVGQALPYVGSALVGGLSFGAVGSAAVAFAVEGQDAYDAAKSRGATETQANIERGVIGAVNAAIEAFQISKIMNLSDDGLKLFKEMVSAKTFAKMAEPGKKLLGKVVVNSIEEGFEEALQEGVTITAPYLVEGMESMPLREDGSIDSAAILKRVGEAALAGAVVSPLLGVGKAAVKTLAAPDLSSFKNLRSAIQDSKYLSEAKKIARLRDVDKQIESMTGEPIEDHVYSSDAEKKAFELLNDLAASAPEVAEFRPEHKKEISKRKAARLAEAHKWGEENKHLVDEGLMTRDEWAIGVRSVHTGNLTPEFQFETTTEIDNYIKDGIRNTLDPGSYEFLLAQTAWDKLTRLHTLPEKSEIEALEPVVGSDIVNKFLGLIKKQKKYTRTFGQKVVDNLMEIANFPRATLASFDMSFIGRQGLKVAIRHPIKEGLPALIQGWKSFIDPKNLELEELKRQTDPDNEHITKKMKVKMQKRGEHEYFASRMISHLPGLSASEAGYIGAGNSMRWNLAKQMMDKYRNGNLTNKEWEELGQAINVLTGLGDSKMLKKLMPIMNFTMFSPRNNIANVQMFQYMNPITLVKYAASGKINPAQKMVAGTLVADGMFACGVLYLLSLIKGVEVERDPLSTDFGKIKIGDSRFEFFGNFNRMARMIAQMLTGKHKTQAGEYSDIEKFDIVTKYLQSKSSPVTGFAIDYLKGEDYLGKPLAGSQEDIVGQIWQRFAPMFIQDMQAYIKYNNLDMDILYAAPLAFHGVTALTYPLSKSAEETMYKNAKAQEFYGDKWENLGPELQQMLKTFDPNITELELISEQEKNTRTVNTRFLKEQRKTEKKLFNSLPKEMRSELNKLLVDVGGLNRVIADGWYLNDQRYAEYQMLVSKELKQSLPMYLEMDLDPLFKRMFIEDMIDDIKELVRREIVYSANINDLEKI